MLLVVTGIEECFQLVVGYRAFFRHNGLGECRQSTQFGIVKLACSQRARSFDGLFGKQFFQGCQFSVAGNAEAAFIGTRGNDLNDFDFAGSQAVGTIHFADFLIKRQSLRRIGQNADQVRNKAVVFQYGFNAWFSSFRSGFNCVYG